MAGMRFTSPPNDNKVRQFPNSSFPGSVSTNGFYNLPDGGIAREPFSNGAHTELHITTPKRVRKISHIPNWSMFIAPELKDAMEKGSSDYTDCENYQMQRADTELNTDYNMNNSEKSDLSSYDQSNNNTHALSSTSTAESLDNVQNISIRMAMSANLRKCPVMQFYSTFGGDMPCNELCDVSDDETKDLPDIPVPSCSTKLEIKLTPNANLSHPSDTTPSPVVNGLTNQMPRDESSTTSPPAPPLPTATKSVESKQDQRANTRRESTYSNNEEEPEKSFFARQSNLSKGLSISCCPLEEKHSFFASIDDNRHINSFASGLDSEPLGESIPPSRKRTSNYVRKTAWNGEATGSESPKLNDQQTNTKKLPRKEQRADTVTPVEEIQIQDGGSVSPNLDRLKIRRFALADPERMIMSQTLRESIEKDIIKRKTSMVRKVSQFFNVKMGLNKEEDLI